MKNKGNWKEEKGKKKEYFNLENYASAEEQRWNYITEEIEIQAEAEETWNTGKKLGLRGNESDEITVKEIARMERADRKERKKNKKVADKGEKKVHQ
ncbi:hypothetical protein ACS0TY_013656 [Phlomoides rotata]